MEKLKEFLVGNRRKGTEEDDDKLISAEEESEDDTGSYDSKDDICQKILQQCYTKLVSDMEPKSMLDQFHEIGFLPYPILRDIKEMQSTSDKNRAIVDNVLTKGDQGYEDMKNCLEKTKQNNLVIHLNELVNQLKQETQPSVISVSQNERQSQQLKLEQPRPQPLQQPSKLNSQMFKENELQYIGENISLFSNKLLGHGSSAVVYEGRFGRFNPKPVAVKTITCSNRQDAEETQMEIENIYRAILVENMETLYKFKSPNVINFIDSVIVKNVVYFAFELAMGTLHDYVDSAHVSWQSTLPAATITREIVDGLNYTHQKKIVHRDLKPTNIFIIENSRTGLKAVIGDYATAKATKGSILTLTDRTASLGYIAPEMWRAMSETGEFGSQCTKQSDIFSLGLVIFFALSLGKHPYGNVVSAQEKIAKASLATFEQITSQTNAFAFIHMLRPMLNVNPTERPMVGKVSEHPALMSADNIMEFLVNESDAFEIVIRADPSKANLLEDTSLVTDMNWMNQLPVHLKTYLHGFKLKNRSNTLYQGKETSIRYLLRVVRNTKVHHTDYPIAVQTELGDFPDGHVALWLKVCPKLLMHVYEKLGPPSRHLDNTEQGNVNAVEFGITDLRYATAYLEALREGEETTNTIRVNIVGNAGVGKSSLTMNLLGMVPDRNIDSTDGIEIHVHKCSDDGDWTTKVVPSETRTADRIALSSVALQSKALDINIEKQKSEDQPSHANLTKSDEHFDTKNIQQAEQLDQAHIFLPVCDVTIKKTPTDNVIANTTVILQNNMKTEQDLLADEVEKDRIRTFSLKLNEKGCTSDKSIHIWDFGGQFVYYATHQLFHSRRAVYLLVLDARKDLNDTVETCEVTQSNHKDVKYFCKFWMHSIHSFVGNDKYEPPVILVATHTDTKPGWNEEKKDKFFDRIKDLFDETPVGKHIQEECFAVNNFSEDSSDVEALREYIVEVAQCQDSWNSKVPAKWIPLEDSINMRKAEKHISLQTFKSMGANLKVPIIDETQIKAFLVYHHALGNLVYFDDEGLSEFVIIEPQWIIDAFKSLITAKECLKTRALRKDWEQLTNHAILRNELYTGIWRSDTSDNQYWRNKDILLKYLMKLGIISAVTDIDIETNKEQHKDYFLVPSLLSMNSSKLCLKKLFEKYTGTETALVFAFTDSIVPPLLNHRLTAAALGKWPVLAIDEQQMLAENVGVYKLDVNHVGLIEVCDTAIEIRVLNLCGKDINPKQADILRRFVRLKIDIEFRRFSEKEKSPYTLRIRCNYKNKKGNETMALSSIENSEYDEVSCPEIHPHNIRIADIKSQWFCLDVNNFKDRNETMKRLQTISKRNLTDPVRERELSKVASSLGINWAQLGIELGLSSVDIDHIKLDNPHETRNQIFNMLKRWSDSEAEKATMEKLLSTIVCVVDMKTNWDKIIEMLE